LTHLVDDGSNGIESTSPGESIMTQLTLQQAFDRAFEHHQAGRLAEAEPLYRQILTYEPNHVDALHYLGVIAYQVGQHEDARELLGRAIALRPSNAEAHFHLGSVLRDLGRLAESATVFQQAITLQPSHADSHYHLGNVQWSLGNLAAAEGAYRQAIVLRPIFPEALSNLGNTLRFQGRLQEAVTALRQAIELQPNIPEVYGNLGNVLRDQNFWDEAVAAYRQALSLRPDFVELHSTLLYTLLFHPGCDEAAIAKEHRRWDLQHAKPLRPAARSYPSNRDPRRKLRVGYVSPNLCEHIAGRFLLPLLREHDRAQFEVFCYSGAARADRMTERFRKLANGWREIFGIGDEQVAALIRADEIDILVDASVHMADNRLRVFARQPAPVQVTFVGYPGTTGLSAIDYRLTDPYLDPPGRDESIYSERTIRLPHSFWCYDAEGMDVESAPDPGSLPALSNGYVTFGCLNNLLKVNDETLRLWGQVLTAVPNAKLHLLAPQGERRQHVVDVLGNVGVAAARIEFSANQPHHEYLKLYQRLDIGLDTLPYNGHTTSLDSFWMGVPVVTLLRQTVVGRAGWSQLNNLRLTELAATNEEEFARLAVSLASDLPRLAELRSTLRERMRSSPLMDAKGYTQGVEAAFRTMWQDWCHAEKG
jgi:predicted O-linked N-acetylglucosamine transferase (SPINDLY family)